VYVALEPEGGAEIREYSSIVSFDVRTEGMNLDLLAPGVGLTNGLELYVGTGKSEEEAVSD